MELKQIYKPYIQKYHQSNFKRKTSLSTEVVEKVGCMLGVWEAFHHHEDRVCMRMGVTLKKIEPKVERTNLNDINRVPRPKCV